MTRRNGLPLLSEFIAHATAQLHAAGLDDAAREARILCAAMLCIDRAALLTHADRPLTAVEITQLDHAIALRAAHEPLARIVGHKEFWGLEFALNDATLVPRPDSETLIEAALELFPDRQQPVRILDLGTGSGCLLLALLYEFPHARGIGVDIAPEAVTIARQNAASLGLAERSSFIVADWNATHFDGPFDLIIGNPPYIARSVIPTLDATVRHYDPAAALDGGADGLDAYRQLAALLPRLRHAGTTTILEIGYDQELSVPDIFAKIPSAVTILRHDLAGQPRCVIISFLS